MADSLHQIYNQRIYPFLWQAQFNGAHHPSLNSRAKFGGDGFIAGQMPGIVTVDGQGAKRHIECRMRSHSRKTVGSVISNANGEYRFDNLDLNEEFDLIARDHTRVYSDVIVPAISPWSYHETGISVGDPHWTKVVRS